MIKVLCMCYAVYLGNGTIMASKGMYIYNDVPGGYSNIEMPGCECPGIENGPILNDTFWCKTYP